MKSWPLKILSGIIIAAPMMSAGLPKLPNKSVAKYEGEEIARALMWQREEGVNLCNGYYLMPKEIEGQTPIAPVTNEDTSITADQGTLFASSGTSTLTGNVTAIQQGRALYSQKAYVDRNSQGKLCRIRLTGKVSGDEPDKRFVADFASRNFLTKNTSFKNMLYRYYKPNSKYGPYDAWGTAEDAREDANGTIYLKRATYSTCVPGHSPWHLYAKDMVLDKQSGRGTSWSTWLMVGPVPVLYSPYLNFSISRQRKTGFLSPRFEHSHRNGYIYTVPFYFNLAPNYDLITKTKYFSKRGVKFNNRFRYMWEGSGGTIQANIIPHDRLFARKRRENLDQYSNKSTTRPYRRLENDKNTRGYLGLRHFTNFNENWSMKEEANFVTDDYYLEDFTHNLLSSTTTQLPNSAVFDYKGPYSSGKIKFLAYQTLHPINQATVNPSYTQIPDIQWNLDTIEGPYGINLNWTNDATYFDHEQTFGVKPTGLRFFTAPTLSLPYRPLWGYVIPMVRLNTQFYNLFTTTNNYSKNSFHMIPSFSLDNGLYFERKWPWSTHLYTQTLEPRLYYTYTPKVNQSDHPNFNTTLPAFDYARSFRMNRNIGVDRIGAANRLSYALTSKLFDPMTGFQVLSGSVSSGLNFSEETVCEEDRDVCLRRVIEPVAGSFGYNISSAFSISANSSYDFKKKSHRIGTTTARLSYNEEDNRIVHIEYLYKKGGDKFPGAPVNSYKNDLSRIHVGASWLLFQHWHPIADFRYNLSHNQLQQRLYGIEYDGCCFDLRVVRTINQLRVNDEGSPTYDRDFFLQIQLKGLGKYVSKDPHKVIQKGLSEYNDVFVRQ